MKIAFSTLSCPRWSFGEITSAAHDLQYNGIEIRGVGADISVPSVPEFGQDQLSNTVKRLHSLSLSIPCLDSDCLIYQQDNFPRTQQEVKAYVDLAERLKSPYVRVFAAPPVPQPMGVIDEALIREHAQELAKYAAAAGITLLFETHGVWADSKKLARLVSAIASPHIGILWDIHHPYRFMGESPEETFDNIRPFLKHVHLKDSLWEGERIRYKMVGQGDLPLSKFVHLLRDSGYEGFYSLEWVKRWDTTLEEPGIVLAHFPNYINNL